MSDTLPENQQLERFGLQWNGPKEFVATPMPDGYWTPWHVAQAEIAKLRAVLTHAQQTLESDSIEYDDVRNLQQAIEGALS